MQFAPRTIMSLPLLFAFLGVSAALAGGRDESKVDLRIRVVTPYRELTRAFWNVSVTSDSGIRLST